MALRIMFDDLLRETINQVVGEVSRGRVLRREVHIPADHGRESATTCMPSQSMLFKSSPSYMSMNGRQEEDEAHDTRRTLTQFIK
jgi:hypothetical protein